MCERFQVCIVRPAPSSKLPHPALKRAPFLFFAWWQANGYSDMQHGDEGSNVNSETLCQRKHAKTYDGLSASYITPCLPFVDPSTFFPLFPPMYNRRSIPIMSKLFLSCLGS